MKKRVQKVLTILLTVSCMLSLFHASASPVAEEAAPEVYTLEEAEALLVDVTEENNVIKHDISAQNLNRYLAVLASSGMSESDRNVEIYKSLGFTEEDIEAIGQKEIDFLMSQCESVTVEEKYIKVDAENNMTVMDPEECLAEAAQAELAEAAQAELAELQIQPDLQLQPVTDGGAAAVTSYTANGSGVNISGDGYMKITTAVSYISSSQTGGQKGWYYVAATFEWLKNPIYQMKDAYNIYSSQMSWSKAAEDNYSTIYYTYELGETYSYLEKRDGSQLKLNDHGVLGEFAYPDSMLYPCMDNFRFYIRGKARVSYYGSDCEIEVSSHFTHTYLGLGDPTFSFSSSGAISISGFGTQYTDYDGGCVFDYRPGSIYK